MKSFDLQSLHWRYACKSVKERSKPEPVLAFPSPLKLIRKQTENWQTFPLLPAVPKHFNV